MKKLEEILAEKRLTIHNSGPDGCNGIIWRVLEKKPMVFICSNGDGWDHVSVSYRDKTPSWDDMCYVKDIFFGPEECVVQYHPAKSNYVNRHPHCLHIWKKQDFELPTPPLYMV